MTKPEIAKAILERRNRMSQVIMPGDMNSSLGPDGLREALALRWLVPDLDEGFLCVTSDPHLIEDMRKLADMKPEQWKPEAIPVAESHDAALLHSRRTRSLNEIAAPMTGGSSPGLSTVAQPQAPQAPQPPQGQPGQPPFGIGSNVMVARQGVKSQGVIEKLNPDGRFQVGFPQGQAKPTGDNIYSKEELSLVPASPQSPAKA